MGACNSTKSIDDSKVIKLSYPSKHYFVHKMGMPAVIFAVNSKAGDAECLPDSGLDIYNWRCSV